MTAREAQLERASNRGQGSARERVAVCINRDPDVRWRRDEHVDKLAEVWQQHRGRGPRNARPR